MVIIIVLLALIPLPIVLDKNRAAIATAMGAAALVALALAAADALLRIAARRARETGDDSWIGAEVGPPRRFVLITYRNADPARTVRWVTYRGAHIAWRRGFAEASRAADRDTVLLWGRAPPMPKGTVSTTYERYHNPRHDEWWDAPAPGFNARRWDGPYPGPDEVAAYRRAGRLARCCVAQSRGAPV